MPVNAVYLEHFALFNIQTPRLSILRPAFSCFGSYFELLLSSVHDSAMAIEDRGPQVEAVAITFLTLSWIAVSLRCYVKFYIIKLFRIDDWFAVLSLV
jgi:hypothetical protein